MTEQADEHWTAGDAYEAYMGRWSRVLSRSFIEWLRPEPSKHWLEVGCGTGALTAAISALARPETVVGCDPSEPFIDHARRHSSSAECTFSVVSSVDELPERAVGFDWVVSALVLNYIPEPRRALSAMRARMAPGGTVAACVWDYAQGLEFVQGFWEEAVMADPGAAALDETKRFEFWQAPEMASLFRAAGFSRVETVALEISTEFSDFSDFWRPLLSGSGAAPSYVASLDEPRRQDLKERLERRFAPGGTGPIRLSARALAARGS